MVRLMSQEPSFTKGQTMAEDSRAQYPLLDTFDQFDLIRRETGRQIRNAREEINMSQGQLSEILARRQAYISEMETGKTEPNATMLVKLAYVLKKPITFFFAPDVRHIGEGDNVQREELTVEEQTLITKLRQLGSTFNQQLIVHLLTALVEYEERRVTRLEDDILSPEDMMVR
jgi:transcriptional regulator with XRE-family HTH domain